MVALQPADTAVTNPPVGVPRVLAHLIYDDVGAAIDWLTEVFGFQERTSIRHTDPDGTISRTQMEVVDSLITLGRPSVHGGSPRTGVSSMLYVYVDNVDEHYEHTSDHGAPIIAELRTQPWGDRCYQTADPQGHQWTFGQHMADTAPDDCNE